MASTLAVDLLRKSDTVAEFLVVKGYWPIEGSWVAVYLRFELYLGPAVLFKLSKLTVLPATSDGLYPCIKGSNLMDFGFEESLPLILIF